MVEWLAGNRIRGTSTERTVGTPEVPAISGAWKEVGRTTLGSTGDTISVTSLPDKRYYMVLSDVKASGFIIYNSRFNSDTGNNYAFRKSNNGGTDATTASTSAIDQTDSGAQDASFVVGYFANKSDKEKLWQGHTVENSSTGAGNAPSRVEAVGKWANTSNAVSSYQAYNSHSGDYASGSEVVVLGYDPDDTHTDNFWEELASVNGDGTGGFDTGTFTAKKYLWVQAYLDPSTSARNNFRVGNTTVDTGNNYANRGSTNDGADATETSVTIVRGNSTSYSTPTFFNMFIINNTSNEKLLIGHSVNQNTSGAATAPSRIEFTSKWTDTSNQIDIIEAFPSSGNYNTGSFIKVWGSN